MGVQPGPLSPGRTRSSRRRPDVPQLAQLRRRTAPAGGRNARAHSPQCSRHRRAPAGRAPDARHSGWPPSRSAASLVARQGPAAAPAAHSAGRRIAAPPRSINVRVGAAEAERADAGDARPPIGRGQAMRVGDHLHRQRVPVDVRVGLGEVQVRAGSRRAAATSTTLISPAMPGADFQVADVGLDRADRAAAGRLGGQRQAPPPARAPRSGSPSGVPVPCAST